MRRGTTTNAGLAAIVAVPVTVVFFLVVRCTLPGTFAYDVLLRRGPIQYVTAFAAAWAFSMLVSKILLLRRERREMLRDDLLSTSPVEVDREEAARILHRIQGYATRRRNRLFVLRVERAMERMAKLGKSSEVDDVLRDQSALDEGILATSYTPIRVLIAIIPMLGFLGTVIGMSGAIGDFARIVVGVGDFEAMKQPLGDVTHNLAVAFDTTYVALVLAILVMFAMSAIQRAEETFLSELDDFCLRHVLGKLVGEQDQAGDLYLRGVEQLQLEVLRRLAESRDMAALLSDIVQKLDQLRPALSALAAPRKLVITEERVTDGS